MYGVLAFAISYWVFMEFIYPFFISFCIVFFSELGDKTQILVLSFSANNKASKILIGIALGTFFSHGLAILFGSQLSQIDFWGDNFNFYLKFFTYISFLIFGIIGFFPKKKTITTTNNSHGFLYKFIHKYLSSIFIIAFSIVVGEFGDKTFLASLGLGLEYPNYKLSLILGSILGMVVSNSFAIFFGKFLNSKVSQRFVEFLSNCLFIVLGIVGLVCLFFVK